MAVNKFERVITIRVAVDWYRDSAVKMIKLLKDGHMILAVFLEILALAGELNEGGYMIRRIPCTPEELSVLIEESQADTERALRVLMEERLIELVYDDQARPVFHITRWDRWQAPSLRSTAIDPEPKEELPAPKDNAPHAAEIAEIIDYLNMKTGKHYRPHTAETRGKIITRLKEGYTVADFKQVIDTKARQWKGDQKMSEYLRPKTLFGKKFEGYLQEADPADADCPEWDQVVAICRMTDTHEAAAAFEALPAAVQEAARTVGTRKARDGIGKTVFMKALSEGGKKW